LLSRGDAVARISDIFRDRGYDGASLSEISKATGLGKGSLYHYFPGGKDEMATAVLERVIGKMEGAVYTPLRASGAPPARLKAMLRALDAIYDGGRNACIFAVLTHGESRVKFQAELTRAFREWIDALRDVAVDAGIPRAEALRRAEDSVARIQGALTLAGALDDPAPFRRALKSIEREFLAAP
jgi:AcrR family transcriptional regulator